MADFTLTFSQNVRSFTYVGCGFTTSSTSAPFVFTATRSPTSTSLPPNFTTTPQQVPITALLTVSNIPSTVTSIGNNAFSMCTSLNSIVIPNSVIS